MTPKQAKKDILDKLEHYDMLLGAEYPPLHDFIEETMDSIRIKARGKNAKGKEIFGEFGHVKITQVDYDKLKELYGTSERLEFGITYLDEAIEMKKYKFANHYLVMRKWPLDETNKALGAHTHAVNQKQDGDGENWIYV